MENLGICDTMAMFLLPRELGEVAAHNFDKSANGVEYLD